MSGKNPLVFFFVDESQNFARFRFLEWSPFIYSNCVHSILRLTKVVRMPLQPLKTFAQFNVGKFMKEKKAVREQQAATHQSIREEKVKLSSTQAKLRRLKVKVSS